MSLLVGDSKLVGYKGEEKTADEEAKTTIFIFDKQHPDVGYRYSPTESEAVIWSFLMLIITRPLTACSPQCQLDVTLDAASPWSFYTHDQIVTTWFHSTPQKC